MENHLTDLDELLEGVRNSRSHDYLSEAINCYRAGAYRSAIVTTWITVCIDIIDKVKELSREGDKQAKDLENKIGDFSNKNIKEILKRDNIKAVLEYETSLLEKAHDELKIISSGEFRLLQKIKDDRNVCAHPDFLNDEQGEQITAEGARYHIVNACNALLHHAPIRGKILIEKIEKRIFEISFPTNINEVLNTLKSDYYLDRAQDTVSQNLIIVLVKTILKKDPLTIPEVERISATLQAISQLKPNIYKATLKEKLDSLLSNTDETWLKRIFLLPNLWHHTRKTAKERITRLVLTLSVDDIVGFQLYPFAEVISDIKPALDSVVEKLTPDDKLKIAAGTPAKDFKDSVIEMFINSGSFRGAEINGWEYLVPHARYFDLNDLKKILDGTLANRYSQILSAAGSERTFVDLFNATQANNAEYKKIWSDFWNALDPNYKYHYPALSKLLVEKQIIPEPPPDADD